MLPARDVRRGDVIVFKYPVDPERDFIKRVIGLPGERLEWRDRKIYINGQPIDEPYVHFKPIGRATIRASTTTGPSPCRPVSTS